MTWNRRKTIVRDREYIDHVWSENPVWTLEEGHSHYAAKLGLKWCLLYRGRDIEYVENVSKGKDLAEKYEREGLPSQSYIW